MKKFTLLLTLLLAAIVSAHADINFRNHRYDGFKPLEVNENSIVFLGNSITNMNEWRECFGNNPHILSRGNSGGFAYEWLDYVESVFAGHPAKIFYGLGTNDLGVRHTKEQIAEDIRSFIHRCHAESPETEIYIQSIHPCSKGAVVSETNNHIEAMVEAEIAAGDGKLHFVDVESQMTNVTSGGLYSYDRLHLTAKSYSIWCHAIADQVGIACTLPAEDAFTADNQINPGIGNSEGMRATLFSALPVTGTDILFIGGHVVHGGEWHEYLANNNVKSRGTKWGAGDLTLADHKKQLVEYILGNIHNNQTAPAKILLYLGAADNDNDAFNTGYKDLLTALKARLETLAPSNSTQIYALSLLPWNGQSAYASKNTRIQSVLAEMNDENIHYVDLTSMVDGNTLPAKYFMGTYPGGIGYAKMAELIATGCDIQPESGREPITEERATQNLALFNARTLLGNTITIADYSSDHAQAALAEMAKLTYDAAHNGTDLDAIVNDGVDALNIITDGQWYTIKSHHGPYVAQTGPETMAGSADASSTATRWQFNKRSDGKYDIVSKTGKYLIPENFVVTNDYKYIKLGDSAPETGWEVKPLANAKYMIIVNGDYQLNLNTNFPNKIVNRGNGTDINDAGGKFMITEAENEAVDKSFDTFVADNNLEKVTNGSDITDGWYIVNINPSHIPGYADTQYAIFSGYHTMSYDPVGTVHGNNTYNYEFIPFAGLAPSMLVRIERDGNNVIFRLPNGKYTTSQFYTGNKGGSAPTARGDAANGDFTIGGSCVFMKNDSHFLIGHTSTDSNRTWFNFYKADGLASTAYDIYQVTITGDNKPADAFISVSGATPLTASEIFDGGFLFLEKGTPLTADNIAASTVGMKFPTVTIADKIITVDYSTLTDADEGKTFDINKVTNVADITTGWYRIKGISGAVAVSGLKTLDAMAADNTNCIINYENEYVHNNDPYALAIGAYKEDRPASAFIHIEKEGNNFYFSSINGHYMTLKGISTLSKENTAIVIENGGAAKISGTWCPFQNTADAEYPFIGFTSTTDPDYQSNRFAISKATDEGELGLYDIYHVSIIGADAGSGITNNVRVTISSDANKGISSVYDNGYFFVTKDTELTADNFSAPIQNNMKPIITVNADDKTIQVEYQSPQNNPFYRIRMTSGGTAAILNRFITSPENYLTYSGNANLDFGLTYGESTEANSPLQYINLISCSNENKYGILSTDGHYIDNLGLARLEPVEVTFNPISDDKGKYYIGNNNSTINNQWAHTGNNPVYVGGSSGSNNHWELVKVLDAEIETYDVYRVSIVGVNKVSVVKDNVKVTLDNEANKGLQSVYDGGYFFVTKGTEITADDFTAPAPATGKKYVITLGEAADGIIPVTVTLTDTEVTAIKVTTEAPADALNIGDKLTVSGSLEMEEGATVDASLLSVTGADAFTPSEFTYDSNENIWTVTLTAAAETAAEGATLEFHYGELTPATLSVSVLPNATSGTIAIKEATEVKAFTTGDVITPVLTYDKANPNITAGEFTFSPEGVAEKNDDGTFTLVNGVDALTISATATNPDNSAITIEALTIKVEAPAPVIDEELEKVIEEIDENDTEVEAILDEIKEAAAEGETIDIEVADLKGHIKMEIEISAGADATVALPSTATGVTGKELRYSSSDNTVASVDNKGTVTAHKAGHALITIRIFIKKSTSEPETHLLSRADEEQPLAEHIYLLTVTQDGVKIESVEMPKSLKLTPGQSQTVTVAVNEGANPSTLSWTSSNEKVATVKVDESNPSKLIIKGISAGTVTITATAPDGTTFTMSVTVKSQPTVTGIEAVNADAANGDATIHDLQGHRLTRVTSAGLYIVNGVKTLVK
ncbi:MAG: Ig-like domain-containing protein [Pseudoflavonifractor sp.]|nr:Ig-like domain-containing protein [Alloprevotella sp.]MCM1116992.1 Ig-like domain-containing protein [Pseudoflavonifractor sp.]